jgi:hypothetical protein
MNSEVRRKLESNINDMLTSSVINGKKGAADRKKSKKLKQKDKRKDAKVDKK